MCAPDLAQYTRETAKDLVEVVTEIHTEIYSESLFGNHPFFSERPFRQRYLMALRQPCFELVMARVDGMEVGYMYGYALRDGSWWNAVEWSEDFQADSKDGYTFENGSRTVVIPEIVVRLRWRRRGVARSMHDKFLARREERRAGLRVLPNNLAAKSAYRKWGWNTVGAVRPVPEAPRFECMVKQLD